MSTASARKARRICRRSAPRAFRRPISRVRSETETSMTFMIPTPATASEMLAMPARARVRAPRIDVNAPRTASWVMAVTSSSPWRSAIRRTTRSRARSRSAWERTWRTRRKSDRRLSIFMAVATGTITTSSMLRPSCWPRGASTPTTRIRQSPTLTTRPTGSSPGEQLARGGLAEHRDRRAAVPLEGREEAAARRRRGAAPRAPRMWRRPGPPGAGAPRTPRSRCPSTIGAALSISGTPRRTARASSRVRSFGAPPIPGMPPVVSVLPGTTMTRFVPTLANWPTT